MMRSAFWADVRTWPSLSVAAAMLGVHKATISRQAHRGNIAARAVSLGRGRRVLPLMEVLRLGHIYQRVPLPDLEHDLAAFVAQRTHLDARDIERDFAEAVTALDDKGEGRMPTERTHQSRVPRWMIEFDQLTAQPAAHRDTFPFMAVSAEPDAVYDGSYRDPDDATLSELTGLDPAIFRR